MSKVWRGLRWVLNSLMILLLLLLLGYNVYVAAARASGQALPKLFGWGSAVVISGSMSGAIEVNDMVIMHEQAEYAAGDVILFRNEAGTTICHRILSQGPDGFVTKGDANPTPDQRTVSPGEVYGKVVLILPRVGVIQEVLSKPLAVVLLAVVVAVLVFLPYFKRAREEEEPIDEAQE